MRFIPDPVAAQCPRCADADKEISFCLPHHDSGENKDQSHRRKHSCAHVELVVSQIPKHGQDVRINHEPNYQCNEGIEIFSELLDVGFEWVNLRNDQEQ